MAEGRRKSPAEHRRSRPKASANAAAAVIQKAEQLAADPETRKWLDETRAAFADGTLRDRLIGQDDLDEIFDEWRRGNGQTKVDRSIP